MKKIALLLIIVIIVLGCTFMHFGGLNTGKSLDKEEFIKYAQEIKNIKIGEKVKIVALGEATHGNKEFQELKLDVFKLMIEKYNIKTFAIEGDYGGCEKVNQYIKYGNGTVEDVVNSIGFKIYNTDQMNELITYMREYNKNVEEKDKLSFYGFDMQRYMHSFNFLKEECKKLNINTKEFENIIVNEKWNKNYDYNNKIKVINEIKEELKLKKATEKTIHFADMLLQYLELKNNKNTDASFLRDKFMAENVKWILTQEDKIFITAHNNHVAKYSSMETMGNLLNKEFKDEYYVIGTDFYKTRVNLPKTNGKRTLQTFYSHDILAKTAKLANLDRCWLDFSTIDKNTNLYTTIKNYNYMGGIGERYSIIMRILPPSYRVFQIPSTLYDSMIFITEASPTKILTKK